MEIYQLCLKSSTINGNVGTFLTVKLTSDFDVALNNVLQTMCLIVFMFLFNVSGCRKMISETNDYVTTSIKRPSHYAT